jgi:nucleoid-associated protein YgaU
MASNQNNAPTPPLSGRKIEVIALLVLAALAMADLGTILYLRHQRAPAPTSPPPPALPSPAAQLPTGPEFDVVRVDPQGNAVLAGRAVPGAVVTIMDNGKVLGTVTVDAQGAFVLLPGGPLQPGAHDITMSETLPNGTVLAGTQTAAVNLPGNGGQVLTVLSGVNGSAVLSGQGPVPGTLGLGSVDYDTAGHAIFTGTAPADAKVNLSLGASVIGSTVADAKGRWHLTAATPATGGMLVLNATTSAGTQLPVVTAPFAPETLKAALAEGHVVIAPGDCLWLIARHVYGQGTMYTLIYTANSSQIHDPNLIFPGQSFVLPRNKAN